ncbi:MAG: extracellular solute-binding protein [Clostridia bacterium]|nr:extracellular solute-binding protein [Clostridia bacterium]
MKRMLTRMLAMALCLLMALPCAFAAEDVVIPDAEDVYVRIVGSAVVGETVYFLKVDGTRADILCWKDGMDGTETLMKGLYYAPNFNSLADIGNEGHAITQIFSDGEQLYGLNHFNGRIFTIDFAKDSMICGDVVTLQNTTPLFNPSNTDWAAEQYGYYTAPAKVIKAGNWMLWQTRDRNTGRYRVLAFNLETGAVKQAVLPRIAAMSSYKDGKALILGQEGDITYDSNNNRINRMTNTVHVYDPDTDELTYLTSLAPDNVSGLRMIAYSEKLDMVVYQDKTRLMGWNGEEGSKQIGFVPTSMSMEDVLCAGEKLLYRTTDNDGITAAAIRKDYTAEKALNILGGTMNKVVSRFSKDWDGIPFYYTEVPAGMSLADYLHAENAPDLIRLTVSEGEYIRLLECGYLKDLSGYAEIKAYADVLYPAYQELVVRDEGVYGVPVYANSYNGWYINKEVMNAMGLTAADIPTDLLGMIEFAQKWNDEWAEKYPHYKLVNDTTGYRLSFLETLMDEWAEYCLYMGKPLNYDDPIFREVLSALEAADFTKIDAALEQTNPEISEYKQALIWTGCKDVGNFASYMEKYSDRIFIPLTLTKDTPYTAAVESVDVWVVNANSKNADEAAALLAAQINVIDNVHAYVLRKDKTEPVYDSYWLDSLETEKERLVKLQEQVAEVGELDSLLEQVEEQRQRIANMEKDARYVVHASAVKNYVEVIAPASVVVTNDYNHNDGGYPNAIIDCMEDFKAGKCTADEFITRMNEAVKEQ